jgi:hypothetical protein
LAGFSPVKWSGWAVELNEDWDKLLPWNIPMDEVKPLRDFLLGAKPDPQRTEPYLLRGKSI